MFIIFHMVFCPFCCTFFGCAPRKPFFQNLEKWMEIRYQNVFLQKEIQNKRCFFEGEEAKGCMFKSIFQCMVQWKIFDYIQVYIFQLNSLMSNID